MDIFRVILNETLDFQEKMETVKYEELSSFFNQPNFHTPFIKIQRRCAANIGINDKAAANSSEMWSGYVRLCIAFLSSAIHEYVHKHSNYFGDRNNEIMCQECLIMLEFCDWLSSLDPMQTDTFNIMSYLTAASSIAEQPEDDIIQVFNDANYNLMTKLFWLRYFHWSMQVRWIEFKHVFEKEYGEQQSYAMNEFQKLLTAPYGRDVVDYMVVDRFCRGYRSLFDAYQILCDPQTTVILSGNFMDQQYNFPEPRIVRSLLGLKITSVSCGDQHIAAITSQGRVYTWGKGAFGRLGHRSEEDLPVPMVVKALQQEEIVQVSCGFAFTGFVSATGRVYQCGAGMNGRMGLGNETNYLMPMMITTIAHEFVVCVQNGSVHSCMLTRSGRVYATGKADFTGHGLAHDLTTPMILQRLDGVVIKQISIASGGFHTLALAQDGRLFAWGHNRVGQLGIMAHPTMPRNEDGGYYLPTPTQVMIVPPDISFISAGWGHSCIIARDGQVYLCGRNVEGQLGLNPHIISYINERGHRYQPIFTPTQEGDLAFARVTQVASGGEHTVFFTSDHDVIGVGQTHRRPNATAAGNTEQQAAHVPKAIDHFRRLKRSILQISCGYNSLTVLVGEMSPPSLRKACSTMIRTAPVLWQHVMAIAQRASGNKDEEQDQPMDTEDDDDEEEWENEDERVLRTMQREMILNAFK